MSKNKRRRKGTKAPPRNPKVADFQAMNPGAAILGPFGILAALMKKARQEQKETKDMGIFADAAKTNDRNDTSGARGGTGIAIGTFVRFKDNEEGPHRGKVFLVEDVETDGDEVQDALVPAWRYVKLRGLTGLWAETAVRVADDVRVGDRVGIGSYSEAQDPNAAGLIFEISHVRDDGYVALRESHRPYIHHDRLRHEGSDAVLNPPLVTPEWTPKKGELVRVVKHAQVQVGLEGRIVLIESDNGGGSNILEKDRPYAIRGGSSLVGWYSRSAFEPVGALRKGDRVRMRERFSTYVGWICEVETPVLDGAWICLPNQSSPAHFAMADFEVVAFDEPLEPAKFVVPSSEWRKGDRAVLRVPDQIPSPAWEGDRGENPLWLEAMMKLTGRSTDVVLHDNRGAGAKDPIWSKEVVWAVEIPGVVERWFVPGRWLEVRESTRNLALVDTVDRTKAPEFEVLATTGRTKCSTEDADATIIMGSLVRFRDNRCDPVYFVEDKSSDLVRLRGVTGLHHESVLEIARHARKGDHVKIKDSIPLWGRSMRGAVGMVRDVSSGGSLCLWDEENKHFGTLSSYWVDLVASDVPISTVKNMISSAVNTPVDQRDFDAVVAQRDEWARRFYAEAADRTKDAKAYAESLEKIKMEKDKAREAEYYANAMVDTVREEANRLRRLTMACYGRAKGLLPDEDKRIEGVPIDEVEHTAVFTAIERLLADADLTRKQHDYVCKELLACFDAALGKPTDATLYSQARDAVRDLRDERDSLVRAAKEREATPLRRARDWAWRNVKDGLGLGLLLVVLAIMAALSLVAAGFDKGLRVARAIPRTVARPFRWVMEKDTGLALTVCVFVIFFLGIVLSPVLESTYRRKPPTSAPVAPVTTRSRWF